MSLTITGILEKKLGLQEVNDNFRKREFVLYLKDPKGREKYDEHCIFQLVNNNISLIDSFEEGEAITVSFNLRGRHWKDDRYFNTLTAWKVEGTGSKPSQSPAKVEDSPEETIGNEPDDLPF